MKIGIITQAASPKYIGYANRLFRTIHLFLPQYDRTAILLTDGFITTHIPQIVYNVPALPKPLNTLLRFHYILQTDLSAFDVIFYIDADCAIAEPIGDEVLPEKIGQIVATQHPWQKRDSQYYEKNPLSKACVLDNKGTHYYQGCFWGGFREDILEMSRKLDANIKEDLDKRIIAAWWDESHMNRYFIDNPPKELPMAYAFPGRGGEKHPWEPRIVHFNYGGIRDDPRSESWSIPGEPLNI